MCCQPLFDGLVQQIGECDGTITVQFCCITQDHFYYSNRKECGCKPQFVRLYAPQQFEASWRSGDAEDCKSLHGGSIPSEASKLLFQANPLGQRRKAALQPSHQNHCRAAAKASHRRKVNRQNQQAQRQHPNAKHRQKTENTAKNEANTEQHPQDDIARHRKLPPHETYGFHCCCCPCHAEVRNMVLNQAKPSPPTLSVCFARKTDKNPLRMNLPWAIERPIP